MNSTIHLPKNTIRFGIPLLLIGLLVWLAKSSFFFSHPDRLAIAITFDLLISVPVIYFFLIRKSSIPKTSAILLVIAGMVAGSYVLPEENQFYLSLFKTWVFPVVEISILSFVIYKVSQAIRGYKTNQNPSSDFYTTLKITCYKILPGIAVIPVVTEIAVFYYGFIHWKKRRLRENEFTYHKNSGSIALLAAILFLVVVETAIFHLLLVKWSTLFAWILTLLSAYTGIQLFGFMRSMLKRPITIGNNHLYLRYGIMTETIIDLKNIEAVEITSREIVINKETRTLSVLGTLETHSIILHLKNENILTSLYGIKRKYKKLAFYVDDKERFAARLTDAIKQEALQNEA